VLEDARLQLAVHLDKGAAGRCKPHVLGAIFALSVHVFNGEDIGGGMGCLVGGWVREESAVMKQLKQQVGTAAAFACAVPTVARDGSDM
jgi:hypothetical protein